MAEALTGRSEKLTPAEIARLRGMSPLQIMRGLKIRPWKVSLLAYRGRLRLRSEMDRIQAFSGMPEVIKQLHADGHELYIMSSNSVQNIQPFLKRYGLSTTFIKVYGNVGVFSKGRVLKRLLRDNELQSSATYYIGDEVRDIEAAKRAGLQMIAVTWGYNDNRILAAYQPTYLAAQPDDILQVFATEPPPPGIL